MKVRSLLRAALAACTCWGLASVASAQCIGYSVTTGPGTYLAGDTNIGNSCDDCTTAVTLPFPVTFFANSYTSLNVGSNGFIDFTTPHANGFYTNGCLPDASGFGPALMVHWNDMRTDAGGNGIFTAVTGVAPNRSFAIEWFASFYDGTPGIANFEVVFYEGRTYFDAIYVNIPSDGTGATAGAQATSTGPFTEYSCNTAALVSGTSIRYTCLDVPGACCRSNGTCAVTLFSSCASSDVFVGAGSACSGTACPNTAVGSCCSASAACVYVASASACTATTSVYTVGGTCTPNVCPSGACCAPTSACSIMSGSACVLTGSTYQGDGTTCTSAPCPAIAWACCFADGSCLSLFQNDCNSHAGATWQPAQSCSTFVCTSCSNVLANPGAETNDMSGWTIDANGGDGWKTDFDDNIHSGARSFSTSYGLAQRHQLIDLTQHFTTTQLDAAPEIAAGEWVESRFDAGAQYYVLIQLLAADGTTVIASFNDGTATALTQIPAGTPWTLVSTTFTGYGAGARFLRFEDGGKSVPFWAGNFGVHFDDAFAGPTQVSSACCSATGCTVITNAACVTAGGTPQGCGTTCSPSPCSTASGVCCRGATCNASVTSANCTTTGSAGAFFAASGATCNPGNISNAPCCYANYNKLNGITVQDIFDFLNDWFAGSRYANVGGNGTPGTLAVQNIFDFLNNWFAGGCS